MKKEIIIINGSGGAGKDTFVNFCSEFTNVMNISSVDKVKEAAKVLTGWNGEKDEKSRKLLVDLKRLGIEYNDAPLKYITEQKEIFNNSDKSLMFVHIREKEEIDKVKNAVGAKTLLIRNDNVKIITSNASDANVLDYNYDYTILNNGTLEDLRKMAEDFVKKI